MPQAIAAVVAWAVPAAAGTAAVVAGVSISYAAIIGYGVFLAGTLALSQYQKRKAERAQRAAFDAAQVDRLANVPATVAPRELVLGRVRKGGTVFFRASTDVNKGKFFICITLAAHEIDGVERIYFNDQPIDLDANGNVLTPPWGKYPAQSGRTAFVGTSGVLPGTFIAGSAGAIRIPAVTDNTNEQGWPESVDFTLIGGTIHIASREEGWNYYFTYQYTEFKTVANVRWYLGAPGQQADPRLQQYFPGVWTPAHRVDNTAYLICEFEFDETAFPSGVPAVTALVRGAKIYDPRSTATAFTEIPALMMRHILLHPQFGKRTSITAAEDARIMAAANACETGISYTGSDWVYMFRAATVMPFGGAARDALDDLAQAMAGQWAYANGEFYCRAGVYQAPVLALVDNDLAVVQTASGGSVSQSAITINPHKERAEKVNTIVARIWDAAAGYIQTPITPFKAAALVADDGVELLQEVTMPAVFYAGQAYHIAGIILRDARDPLTVTLPFKLSAYQLELFDSITLTLSRYGWTAKEFQVMSRRLMPTGYIELTLKETSVAIYQIGSPFLPQGYASNSGLPRPWDVVPPTITSITSGEDQIVVQPDGALINGVRIQWAAVQDASVSLSGFIDAQYARVVDGVWRTVTVQGGDTEAVFLGLPDNDLILVRVRSRSSIATSDWSVQKTHKVIGKTAPPPNIENLSISGSVLTWTLPRRVPDLAGFLFRFHYGSNFDWNSAAPMHDGFITENPWEPKTRPGGVVTIMGKALDSTGNESLATANIVMNLGDPPIANVVEQWDFDALGWPAAAGEQSGWTMVADKPTATDLDSLYGTDDQSFYGQDTDPFYDVSAFGRMVYVTDEVPINSALAGSIMTLTTQADGIDLRIEYRLSGPGSRYGSENSSFYGPDDDPFYGAPGDWRSWPGQLIAENDVYQFRVTIGAGATQGVLREMVLTVDAPDIEESLADVVISNAGTVIPYTRSFTSIKTVQATLQANGSGAETVEVNKSVPLAPVIRAFNAAHVAVSGSTADIVLKGY